MLPLLFVLLISGYGIVIFYNLPYFVNSSRAIFNLNTYLLISVIVSFCIGLALTYAILIPMRRLSQMLKDIENDSFSLVKHPYVEEEIEEVFQSFEHLHTSFEKKKKRESLQRLASLGQLAAGVAHEIRNPLGSIKGLMNLIDEDLSNNDPKKEYIRVILQETQRMEDIISRFLMASPSKYTEIHRETINLDSVLDEAIALAGLNPQAKDIELIKENNFAAEIIGDKKELKQALLNIILNAYQAMSGGGTLRVSVKKPDRNNIQVWLSDTGTGIAKEDVERIFDPFFTKKDDGVGLGLAIAHQIITAHRGNIKVESVEGKGSDFIISLPIGVSKHGSR